MDRIFLRDLKVETVIGIYEWERRIRQIVSLDPEEPLTTICVEMPLPEVMEFELWLDQNSDGQGRLDLDES